MLHSDAVGVPLEQRVSELVVELDTLGLAEKLGSAERVTERVAAMEGMVASGVVVLESTREALLLAETLKVDDPNLEEVVVDDATLEALGEFESEPQEALGVFVNPQPPGSPPRNSRGHKLCPFNAKVRAWGAGVAA